MHTYTRQVCRARDAYRRCNVAFAPCDIHHSSVGGIHPCLDNQATPTHLHAHTIAPDLSKDRAAHHTQLSSMVHARSHHARNPTAL